MPTLRFNEHAEMRNSPKRSRQLHNCNMHTTYFDEDDILVIRLSEKRITYEVSQNWNTHISYAEDGSAVEVVVLEACTNGAYPLEVQHARAA